MNHATDQHRRASAALDDRSADGARSELEHQRLVLELDPRDSQLTNLGSGELSTGAALPRVSSTPQRRLAPFLAVALVGQLSAIAFPGIRSVAPFLASSGLLLFVAGVARVLSRRRAPKWVELLMACVYLGSLALLFMSQHGGPAALQPLVLLPIVWVALYQSPTRSTIVVGAAACMLALTSWLAHAPLRFIVVDAGIWGLAGGIVVLGAGYLRRWLGGVLDQREEALRQARVLEAVASKLNSTLDPERVVAIAVRLAAEIASPPGLRPRRANYCRIYDGIVRVDAEFDGEGEWVGASWPLHEHPLLAEAVRTRAATSGALDPATLGPTVRGLAAAQHVGHGGWVPVIVAGELHGVLAVAGRNRPVSDHDLSRCVAIVRIMELALANALTHERLQRAALTDPLTALANRRGMTRMVHGRRDRDSVAVLAIDVDGLKEVNDRDGHAAGDELLLLVADAIRSVVRGEDLVARVGGDEFVCILSDADEDAGAHVAGRLLEAALDARHRGDAPRLSIGVACAAPGTSLDDTIRRADAAMYEAKRAGGMRYTLASSDPVPRREARIPAVSAAGRLQDF